ncbi:LEM domain-containing protein 1 isoform X2 [Xiphophorus hellerii]|uniref:LEM domain-containing protein 1 isoform X2 n=1 Tax=Xiphophorus hellerii TaxID=8084 RepID=UPI0013B4376F|nr:lamina-associated polypeptide 2, isoforms beta/delta/epsilon/gamma-like isoform X2 [Xiphophorus hellerii]
MPFVEDPACLSKSRLKSDLVAHNVELPPAGSKKEAYVALHLRHVDQTNAADFSSDDDQEHNVAGGDPGGAKELDPSALTDKDLKALLFKYGVKAGPILASTRAVYEKKLRKLLQSAGEGESNEADNAVLYSDSDEEDVSEKDEEKELEGEQEKKSEALELNQQQCNEKNVPAQKGDFFYPQCFFLSSRLRPCPPRNNERSSKRNSKNALKSSERTHPHRSQIPAGISKVSSIAQHSGLRSGVPSGSQSVVSSSCSSFSSQAFSITQMVEKESCTSSLMNSHFTALKIEMFMSLYLLNTHSHRKLMPNDNNKKKQMESRGAPSACSYSKPEHWSRSSRLDTDIEDKDIVVEQAVRYTPKDSTCVKEIKDPVKDILKDLLPDTKTSPTGIYATPRRPIKGAAQRPIQYAYPDTPVSPTTLERQEVARRLAPVYVQVLVFFAVMCILFLIFVNVENTNSVVSLLERQNQRPDGEEGIPVLDETQDAACGEL